MRAKIFKWRIDSVEDSKKMRWAMSAEKYVKLALTDVEKTLEAMGKKLPPAKASSPFSSNEYRAELDTTPELDEARTNYFQGLIGVLRWCIELGRVDILTETMLLSSYLASP